VPMLEGKVDHVIGVDTHRDNHAAAILDRNGGLVAQLEVPSSQAGYATLLSFVAERAPSRRCWALEGPAATAPDWRVSWPTRASG
jgi:transposase